ncbi:MAG TPA: hypothetical protein VFJ78_09015 [Gaiellaceae bacterium]|nr:hypothetical protein [Gaiellaceae bacterium]
MRRRNVLYAASPVLASIAGALPVASGNVGEYTAGQLLAVLAVWSVVGLVVQLLVGAILARRTAEHRVVVATVAVAWLASAPAVAQSLPLGAPRFGVLILAVPCALLAIAVLRRTVVPEWLVRAVAIFTLAMVASGAIAGVSASRRIEALVARAPTARALLAPLPRAAPGSPRPDVYVIVLDNFANARIQAELYGRSNRPFEDSLRALGFVIPSQTRSSYTWTPHSIASLLDLGHVRGLEADLGSSSVDWAVLYRLIQRNRTARWMHDAGYTVYFQPSVGFAGTAKWVTPHVRYGEGGRDAFEVIFARNRLLRAAFHNTVSGRVAEHLGLSMQFREARLHALRTVADVANRPGPKFVFAHSLVTHEPFDVAADCGAPGPGDSPDRMGAERYLAAIACTERLVLAAVTHIVQSSPTRPVIVVQGDHGTLSLHPPFFTPAEDVTADQAFERTGAFGAYLIPGVDSGSLPQTVTPPNVLRLVFSRALGVPLAPVPDSSYYVALGKPFHFVNVTERVEAHVAAGGGVGPLRAKPAAGEQGR